MEKKVEFIIHGEIKTKARPRARVVNNYAIIYTPKDTVNYENLIKFEYLNQANGEYFSNKALNVQIDVYFKAPKHYLNLKKYVFSNFIVCSNQKDLDNIAKTILDALNKIAYDDDRQVCKLNISKYYSFDEKEYIKVIIKEEFGNINDLKNLKRKKKLEPG